MNLRTVLTISGSAAVFAFAALVGAGTASAAPGEQVLDPLPAKIDPQPPKIDLTIAARASADRIAVGDLVTYTVAVANRGSVVAKNVVIVGIEDAFRLAALSSTRLITSNQITSRLPALRGNCESLAECTLGKLAPGQSADVKFVYRAQSTGTADWLFRVRNEDKLIGEGRIAISIEAARPEASSPGDATSPADPDTAGSPEKDAADARTKDDFSFDEADFDFDNRYDGRTYGGKYERLPFDGDDEFLPYEERYERRSLLEDEGKGHRKAKKSKVRRSAGKASLRCTIIGGPRADVLRGTHGRDVICGRGGNDVLIGLGGDDIIRGGPGKDRLVGGRGQDRLYGDAGDDMLVAREGLRDMLAGGRGTDTALVDGRDRMQGVERLA